MSHAFSIRRLCPALAGFLLVAAGLSGPAMAQTYGGRDPLGTNPRGLTDIPPALRAKLAANPALMANPAIADAVTSGAMPPGLSASGVSSGSSMSGGNTPPSNPNANRPVQPALPPDPATAVNPVVFGSQMFTGRFGTETFAGFNPDYQVAIGDRVSVRMWGAFSYDAVQSVDVKGNIFIPNVGPVQVLGVRNADLNNQLESQFKRIFRTNVGVYATLEAAQPVKIYVTGFVRAPGLYGGLSSDSVLYYLDRAGGIDPDRGSYLKVDVMRGGKLRSQVDLYAFLIKGRIDPIQLQDGDTIVVQSRKHSVAISGEVANPYIFEIDGPTVSGAELLALASPRPGASHLSIVHNVGADRRSDYYALADAANVKIQDGDEITVTSDKAPGTILVRIDGAHLGERVLVLPYGAKLSDAMARLRLAPQSRIEAIQLFRKSVALRQKDLLETSLRSLETYALTARSATSEEAALRGHESQQILEFIDRARKVEPRGQVILSQGTAVDQTLLEDGDVITIPVQTNLVMVGGEVLFPNALVYDTKADAEDYIARSGGYTQGADRDKLIVIHQDGSVTVGTRLKLQPGDQIMALPKIETKSIEVTRGITQIIYQVAVAAKVLFGL